MIHQEQLVGVALSVALATWGAILLPIGVHRLRSPYHAPSGWVGFWESALRMRVPSEMGWVSFRTMSNRGWIRFYAIAYAAVGGTLLLGGSLGVIVNLLELLGAF